MMSRGYGAMLFKKSAAGLDHLKQNVSKFLKQPFVILLETLPQVQVPAGNPPLQVRAAPARATGATAWRSRLILDHAQACRGAAGG